MSRTTGTEDILRLFDPGRLSSQESHYLKYHLQRLAYTVNLVQNIVTVNGVNSILDIGPHFLTMCLKELLTPRPAVSTLGFSNERLFPMKFAEDHIEMDLNKCSAVEFEESDMRKYDLITFSETIEHLYTSPLTILKYLSKLLTDRPGSGILIQTPNAASFLKRIRLLFGHNPFEEIREDTANPGHFREYTMKELIRISQKAGFKISFHEYCAYWSGNNLLKHVFDIIPSFREGITIFIEKKHEICEAPVSIEQRNRGSDSVQAG
jgi:hypothetical protein